MELQIWKGDWGLPSVDVSCLQVMCYAKFSGAPLKLKSTNNPFRTPKGALPVFRHDSTVLTKFTDITAHLRKHNYNADYELSGRQCAEVVAYSQLLQEKLIPALQYVWWIDAKNQVEFARPWYAKALPFPLNFYYPGLYIKQADELISVLYKESEEEASVTETAVYKNAEECLTLLSTKLGDREFFYGSSPCSLDAVVFAHLAPLLKAPLPSAALQNHLKACTNLSRFVGRVLQRYFLKDIQEYDGMQRSTVKEEDSNADPDFPHRKRNMALAGFVAVAAMTAYAFSSGIVQVVPADSSEDQGVYDDDEEEQEENDR